MSISHDSKGVFVLQPTLVECPWGSDNKSDFLGYCLTQNLGTPVGELWMLSDRDEYQSHVIVNDKPIPLHGFLSDYGETVIGPTWKELQRLRIMIKILVARENLSVQVHPDHKTANKFGGEQKEECWLVLRAESGAKMYAGLTKHATPESMQDAFGTHEIMDYVGVFPVEAGNFIPVPSGCVHALGAGCTVLEVSDTSDTTYRGHDWGRVGLDGKPRQLHREEFLDSIDYAVDVPDVASVTDSTLMSAQNFRVRQFLLTPPSQNGFSSLFFSDHKEPRLIYTIYGSVGVNGKEMGPDKMALMSYDHEHQVELLGPTAVVVIIDRFV